MPYLSAILPLFSSILYLCLGMTVYFLSRGSLRTVFLRFCAITFHWQFLWFILFIQDSGASADLLCRIGYSGIIFLPVSCYEAAVRYLDLPRRHVTFFYGLCLVFLVLLWTTDLFIRGARLQSFGYYPEAGVLHPVYLAMVLVLIGLLLHRLFRVFRMETDPIRKTQLRFFFISSIIFCFSAVDYLLNYPSLVERFQGHLYPVGVFFISFSLLVFVLSHFITLNLTLEKRVTLKTAQLEESVAALEEAARHKKDFIANVTHELRTPLTLIRGWTNFILEGKAGALPGRLADITDKISVQTLGLTEKINELLKVSRFDAGMATLVLSRMDLDEDISAIVTGFRGLTDQSGVTLSYIGCPEIGDVFLDREKVKDIMNNLIRNAYKFTEKGSIRVSLGREGDRAAIRVADTGIGMPREVLERIFQRFRQGDGSMTRRYEGTGLGLSIVKDSAEMMHGEVSVESAVGRGSVFTITLPLDLEAREPGAVIERRVRERRSGPGGAIPDERRSAERRKQDLARIDNEDILRITGTDRPLSSVETVETVTAPEPRGIIVVAEDNRGIQEFLKTTLEGYTLVVASTGQAAWQAIQEKAPDLVISDIMMPVMDGYTLLGLIRGSEKTANLPVIIITSLIEQEDRIKALRLGANDYLAKPFHHLELQARVENVISVHRLEQEKTRAEQLEVFLMVLASVIESKDKYTGGHVERVAGYARDLARKAGVPEAGINDIYLGTIVHDVGKIGIRDSVLNKPGKLTPEEFEHIKTHTVIGKNLLAKLQIAPVAVNIAHFHQEKWDGTGYPEGLKGETIPLEARIAAIADFWDAITSDRPYRTAMPLDKALDIMHGERGKTFDPDLFDLFMDEGDRPYLRYLRSG
jgi:putative two-component system response regulator